MTYQFVTGTIPHDIFVIGAGGTGSRLIPMLAQFIRSITMGVAANGWLNNPRIHIIDGDIVEEKNMLRQNFIAPDVGKNKAEVLANRYARAFGVNITALPKMLEVTSANGLTTSPELEAYLDSLITATARETGVLSAPVVIMCVDSVAARRKILAAFLNSSRIQHNRENAIFFIDAGNEDTFGQVTFYNSTLQTAEYPKELSHLKTGLKMRLPKMFSEMFTTAQIPFPYLYYKDMVPGTSTRSCADLDQTLAINSMMATTIIMIMQNFYYRRPMDFNTVSMSMDGGYSVTRNTLANWASRAIPDWTLRQIQTENSSVFGIREQDGTTSYLITRVAVQDYMRRNIESEINARIEHQRRIDFEASEKLARELEEEQARAQAARDNEASKWERLNTTGPVPPEQDIKVAPKRAKRVPKYNLDEAAVEDLILQPMPVMVGDLAPANTNQEASVEL